MKAKRFLLVLVAMVLPFTTNAVVIDGHVYEYIDGLIYELSGSEASLTSIPGYYEGGGEEIYYVQPRYNRYEGGLVIPGEVLHEGKSYKVTSIGNQAFYYCSGLTSVTIPSSVTSIGSYAFQNCTSIIFVDIPKSVKTIKNSVFSGCRNLTSVRIPDGITKIERGTFRDCKSLPSITIPNSVTFIGDHAFSGCI